MISDNHDFDYHSYFTISLVPATWNSNEYRDKKPSLIWTIDLQTHVTRCIPIWQYLGVISAK